METKPDILEGHQNIHVGRKPKILVRKQIFWEGNSNKTFRRKPKILEGNQS